MGKSMGKKRKIQNGSSKWGLDAQSEALVALIAVIAMTVALELWGYYSG